MNNNRTIKEALQIITGTKNKFFVELYQGNIYSVDIPNRTALVNLSGDNSQITCNLQTSVGDGLLLVPTVNSTVTIMFNNTDNIPPTIIQYSDVDYVYLNFNSNAYINSGPNNNIGGLVKVMELTKQLNNLENLLMDLIQKYNNAVTTFSSHTHIFQGTVAGTACNGTTNPTTATFNNESYMIQSQQGNVQNFKAATVDYLQNPYIYQGSGSMQQQ